MATEVKFYGTVPLKEGVTLGNVLELYNEAMGEEAEEPTLPLEPEGSFTTEFNEVDLTVSDGILQYNVDGVMFSSFVGYFEDFLADMAAKHASAGWIDYSGDDDSETPYGPDERSRNIAVYEVRKAELTQAIKAFDEAAAKL